MPRTVVTHLQVLSEVANTVRREAFVMAYSDCFFVIGIALALCIPPLFMARPPLGSAAAVAE